MRGRVAAFIFGAALLGASVFPAFAEEARPTDVYGLGLDLAKICDLQPGAPVSEGCRGFMGAIAEMALSSQGLREQGFDETSFLFVRTCIPPDRTLDEIIEAVRSHIAPNCTGLCSETGYVLSALELAYPCPEE